MILTGNEIEKEIIKGNIIVEPFIKDNMNPNSYNYRLGNILKEIFYDKNGNQNVKEIVIPEEGYLLKKECFYLGNTFEKIGSKKYSMRLIGRSSIGRYGLFLQISADLGHVGSCHCWTLEIIPLQNILVYPLMKIGQVSFWENFGEIDLYNGYYGNFSEPTISKGDF